ncbi:ethylbenzene dehydrogenase-related protein [Halorussus salinisoli]|uniref:ethylbenzene dehydrogenase-related protein n=1 Tax=Halorussus salinisoli TaxID=2558242 RepID=UPI0010C20875|nr:ethylbenzene dehydrogenase-related protein [Halorussus salinisoli]
MRLDRTGPGTKLTVALALVAVVAVVPQFVVGQDPAGEIPVLSASQSQASSLSDPTAPVWNDAATVTVPLSSAPSNAPNANDTSIERMNVQTARSEGTLFVRLTWSDATEDGNVTPSQYETPRTTSFGDAVAVQFPANASAEPGIAMGGPNAMVNLWWWNGAQGDEELLAAGPGTSTRFPNASVEANGTYRDGRWHVVFERKLPADADRRTDLDVNENVNVAFAVWNGSNAERAGRKSVSDWQYLPFGPEPEGPPYQTILWTIAGIAIVVVVAVSAMAVQRGGS